MSLIISRKEGKSQREKSLGVLASLRDNFFVFSEACLPKERRLRMSLFISRKEGKSRRSRPLGGFAPLRLCVNKNPPRRTRNAAGQAAKKERRKEKG